MNLGTLYSLYMLVKDEEKERDEKIEESDIGFDFIGVCKELGDRAHPSVVRKKLYPFFPELKKFLLLMSKTQQSRGDRLLHIFRALVYEFFDDPSYPPKLEQLYKMFIMEVALRVDLDSKFRAEYLRIFRRVAKRAGMSIIKIAREAEQYSRARAGDAAVDSMFESDYMDEDEETDEELEAIFSRVSK